MVLYIRFYIALLYFCIWMHTAILYFDYAYTGLMCAQTWIVKCICFTHRYSLYYSLSFYLNAFYVLWFFFLLILFIWIFFFFLWRKNASLRISNRLMFVGLCSCLSSTKIKTTYWLKPSRAVRFKWVSFEMFPSNVIDEKFNSHRTNNTAINMPKNSCVSMWKVKMI